MAGFEHIVDLNALQTLALAHSADPETLILVLERVSKVGTLAAQPILQHWFEHTQDPRVFRAALNGLASVCDDRAEALVDGAVGEKRFLREVLDHVCADLARGGKGISRLVVKFTEDNPQLRRLCVDAVLKEGVKTGWERLEPAIEDIGWEHDALLLADIGAWVRDLPEGEAKSRQLEALWEVLGKRFTELDDDDGIGTLETLWECDWPLRMIAVEDMLKSEEYDARVCAVQLLATTGDEKHLKALLEAAKLDSDDDVRCAALHALFKVNHEIALKTARRALRRDKNAKVRAEACKMLKDHGDAAQDRERLLKLLRHDQEEAPALAAFETLKHLVPNEMLEVALDLLGDQRSFVAKEALAHCDQADSVDETCEALTKALKTATPELVDAAIAWSNQRAPKKTKALVSSAMENPDAKAQLKLSQALESIGDRRFMGLLKQQAQSGNGQIRVAALQAMRKVAPEHNRSLTEPFLGDCNAAVRAKAVAGLVDDESRWALEAALKAARDESMDVRIEALRAMRKFDDPRVFAELVSSLNDVTSNVRDIATGILTGAQGPVPSLDRVQMQWGRGSQPVWEVVRRRVEAINRWAVFMGQELLGKPVVVHQYRQGLGRTHAANPSTGTVEIEVSDTPVTSGHPHGEEVMKGLVLHELGHHLCDIGVRGHHTMRSIARSAKIKDIYDILIDERLERTLRSRRPAWGLYFDRLASYAFAQDEHRMGLEQLAQLIGRDDVRQVRDEIIQGVLPGRLVSPEDGSLGEDAQVALRDSDLLGLPGVVPLTMGFLWCLRCGFDPRLHHDPRVAEAVSLVPTGLRHINHAGVLKVAREVARVLEHEDGEAQEQMQRMTRLGQCGSLGSVLGRLSDANMLPESHIQDGANIRQTPEPKVKIVTETKPPDKRRGRGGQTLNLGDDIDFPRLKERRQPKGDAGAESHLVAGVRKHVRRLRGYMERLGRGEVEEYASRRGRRLDMAQARKVAWSGRPNLLVHNRQEIDADAYIGLLIDASGSMSGRRLQLAQSFGALVTESARGLRGLEGRVDGFDDQFYYELGDFQRHNISALESGGGNNDSGALLVAAQHALASRKRNRLLVMISDGSPSACTVESLRRLVGRLTRQHGIICAQAAVASIDHQAFAHSIDLTDVGTDVAVARFGAMLMRLTRRWR